MRGIPDEVLMEARTIMDRNGFENAWDEKFVSSFVAYALIAERERCIRAVFSTNTVLIEKADQDHLKQLISDTIKAGGQVELP